jgi:transcriptional regulator with XRE-family HTH domain
MEVGAMQRRTRSPEHGPVRQRIGPTIKALRLEHGLSLNDLAEDAGISPSHLSRMERGLTVPSYDVLDRVADALGSDLRALRQEEEEARAVDAELNGILDRLGIAPGTQAELLRLTNPARHDLADALRRAVQQASA